MPDTSVSSESGTLPNRLDAVGLLLPDGLEQVGDEADAETGRFARQWRALDGTFVVLESQPAEKEADLDPLSLDLIVGGTLERYELFFEGEVVAQLSHQFDGALAGRIARCRIVGPFGDPLVVLLVSALTSDRQVVTLQVSYPLAQEPALEPTARQILERFRP